MKVFPAVHEAAVTQPSLPDAWSEVPEFPDDGIYPTSTPTMPELAPHSDNGDLIRHAIKCRFKDWGRSCRCLGNVHLFYREGVPDYVAPDVMVFPDLPGDYPAPHYKIWEDGVPALVVEVLSKSTWRDDIGVKKDAYHAMGVREYWIFNPIRSIVPTQPALQGYYRHPDGYAVVESTLGWVEGIQTELFPSDVLDTVWGVNDNLLRLFNPREKTWYPSSEGSHAQKKDAERRATTAERQATEAQRRAATAERQATAVEAEIERLQRLLHAHGLALNGQPSSEDETRGAGAACP